jgi:hypothetical protein
LYDFVQETHDPVYLKPSPAVLVGHVMADDLDTRRTRLDRLADLVEQAQLLPLEDRARLEGMITQARQAVCEARQGKQQLLERREVTRIIVLRHLAKEAHRKVRLTDH